MVLLEAKHLSLKQDHETILADVSLKVERGQIVTIVGPNGAGKSTLLKVMLGLLPKDTGEVYLAPKLKLGYMPQKLSIEPYLPLSVGRFLSLAGKTEVSRDVLDFVVDLLHIKQILSRPLQKISGGELQRILLARALLHKPDLLVLDEPVQGVDVLGQEALYRLISKIREIQNCGVLMVSHDLHLVMAETDFVICLNKHVCCTGTPEVISKDPEYLNLFGLKAPMGVALYVHRHDHRHDPMMDNNHTDTHSHHDCHDHDNDKEPKKHD